MNFFNDAEKILYRKKTEEPISLVEYIKFVDEKRKNKYLLFKFQNNFTQVVKEMSFEIYSYDSNDNKIGKTVFKYTDFEAKGLEIFVPTSKLEVPFETAYIEVRLFNATFETVTYADEKFTAIPYTSTDFSNGSKRHQDSPKEKKVKQQSNTAAVAKGIRKTKYKDVTRANKIRAPKVVATILTLVVIAISVLGIIRIKNTTSQFTDANFEYTIVNSKEVVISKYLGKSKKVSIPSTYKKFKVTKIEDNAFASSKIQSIEFTDGGIIIDKKAFANCEKLETVTDKNGVVTLVNSKAFLGCENLEKVLLPNATIVDEAFTDCFNVTEMAIGNSESDSFTEIFGGEIPSYLTKVSIKTGQIDRSYFGECNILELELTGAVEVYEGAFNKMSLQKLSIYKDADVEPSVLRSQFGLTVYLAKENQYTKDDYLDVNSHLTIKTLSK